MAMNKKLMIGAAVGSGIVALAAERGGADFLLAINAGRMRNMGAPSIAGMLPIRDAQELTESFALREVLNQCSIPVLLGVDCWGYSAQPKDIAKRVFELGFGGAVNFPTSIHYFPAYQNILERAGRGITREVEVLSEVQKLGLTSLFYCATRAQAALACEARLDMILLNFGWNSGGTFGHRQRQSVDETAVIARDFARFVKRLHPKVKFLMEGGPVVTADDLGRVLQVASLDGYVGGSTIERLPLETSVAERIASYKFAFYRNQARDAKAGELAGWGKKYGFTGNCEAQLNYLSQLRIVADGDMPLLLTHAPGVDLIPTLNALSAATGAKDVQTINPGAGDRFGAAGRRIFGTARGEARRIGALGDEKVALLIIQSPEMLPPSTQLRLARALSEGSYTSPGTRKRIKVAARCVFVLEQMETDGLPPTLANGLAQVFNDWRINLPTVAERAKDLPDMLKAQIKKCGVKTINSPIISDAGMQLLIAHDWPGNERELYATMARLILEATSQTITADRVEGLLKELKQDETGLRLKDRSEKARVVEALWRHGFNRSHTAAALGISRKTLYNKIRKFALIEA